MIHGIRRKLSRSPAAIGTFVLAIDDKGRNGG
ncbi:MAG: hypothetical protein ACI93T_003474 [Porticoccaceae bacterium]